MYKVIIPLLLLSGCAHDIVYPNLAPIEPVISQHPKNTILDESESDASTPLPKGFALIQYRRGAYYRLQCSPHMLTTISLQPKEKINQIDIGDSNHWQVSTAMMGSQRTAIWQVNVMPSMLNRQTDLFITTTKHTYHFNLSSRVGEPTHEVKFKYPKLQSDCSKHLTQKSLHFNYAVKGHPVPWHPIGVADDGENTFIYMPSNIAHLDLPLLYQLEGRKQALINYRYSQNQFVVDGVYHHLLMLGHQHHKQQRILIDNLHWRLV